MLWGLNIITIRIWQMMWGKAGATRTYNMTIAMLQSMGQGKRRRVPCNNMIILLNSIT